MRQVNFSIPNANKASVAISTALYDRRALDCSSTLPLINSLNHLAYLTTSSARIRDILTVDGGVERLVFILKQRRTRDILDTWKWNLAFQCLVNIGVRGSESVRTRVVQADMVPVIATVLDNYLRIVERCRERAEAHIRRDTAVAAAASAAMSAGYNSVPTSVPVPVSSLTPFSNRPPLPFDLTPSTSVDTSPSHPNTNSASGASSSSYSAATSSLASSSLANNNNNHNNFANLNSSSPGSMGSSSATSSTAVTTEPVTRHASEYVSTLSSSHSTPLAQSFTTHSHSPSRILTRFDVSTQESESPQYDSDAATTLAPLSPPPSEPSYFQSHSFVSSNAFASLLSSSGPTSADTSVGAAYSNSYDSSVNPVNSNNPTRSTTPVFSSSRNIDINASDDVNPTLQDSNVSSARSRELDHIPSMLPSFPTELASQPQSPTTPSAHIHHSQSSSSSLLASGNISLPMSSNVTQVPSPLMPLDSSSAASSSDASRHRHQLSVSAISDDDSPAVDETRSSSTTFVPMENDPVVGIRNGIHMHDIVSNHPILHTGTAPVRLPPSTNATSDVLGLPHQSTLDASSMIDNVQVSNETASPSGTGSYFPSNFSLSSEGGEDADSQQAAHTLSWHSRFLLECNIPPDALAAMPRDEDVLMSLQLLAYVSKYCNLRTYFQKSHIVPQLRIQLNPIDGGLLNRHNMKGGSSVFNKSTRYKTSSEGIVGDGRENSGIGCMTDLPSKGGSHTTEVDDYDYNSDNEYVEPEELNIFPLVERFTIRYHSQEMQYWAGVVMRNLCRRDDTRGGIRQCAYYQCGKWEEYTRQFAKCRRCRRTKYCSKECQKNAWAYHRHWCVQAQQ